MASATAVAEIRPIGVTTEFSPAVEVSSENLDDGLLMKAVAKGDEQAFAAFYDRFAPRVLGTVRSVLRDHAISEEVTQEVFVEAWKQAPRYDAERGRLDSWLLTMARRRAIDRVRSEQAARDRGVKAATRSVTRAIDEVAEWVEVADEHAHVRRAMAVLTDVQREAIVRAYFGGRTYREVAEELGAPLSTIKTRIRDGMIRLRDELGQVAPA